ncbi:hypothetical protein ABSY17_01885 (plasmid) [Mesorhizobium sp. ANAO-SY3R2]
MKPLRKHPSATGYIDRLYAIEGLDGSISQEVEKNLLSPVDSKAASALKAILGDHSPILGGALDDQSGWDQGRQTQNARHDADSPQKTAPRRHGKSSNVSQTQL